MRDLHQIDGSFVLLAAKGDEWVSKWCRVGKNITIICECSDHQIESDYLICVRIKVLIVIHNDNWRK